MLPNPKQRVSIICIILDKDLGNLLRLIKPEYKICLWGIGVMGVSSGVLLFIPQLFLVFIHNYMQ